MIRKPFDSKVLLVAMPWANPEVPSIQIAALKAHLEKNGIPVEAGHWYLDVALALGFPAYAALSSPEVSAAETLYSYLAFPEMRRFLLSNAPVVRRARKIERNLAREVEKPDLIFQWNDAFFRRFRALHRDILDRYDWSRYALVGFTLNYGQTVASLFMAREIKKRNPACKIIFGGAEASGELGRSLIENFSEIDYACNGEGELLLLELCRALMAGSADEEIQKIGGLTGRRADGQVYVNAPRQVEDMQELATPDYDDYFDRLKQLEIDPQSIIRELPIEASRGCPFSCTFCGLNLQWENFRSQSHERVSHDIRYLSTRYNVLGFRFMDNILPRNSEKIFEEIAKHGVDYRFFYEIRAQTPPRVLRLMKEAGAVLIQCGVEALSTPILKKFNKHSRFIHNLQAMKLCEELNIRAGNNIIVDFPLSANDDVTETVRNMEYCLAYQPANLSTYSLTVGSPDYEKYAAERGGKVPNADIYRYIYPPKLFKTLHLIAKEFKHRTGRPRWSEAKKALARWKKVYDIGKKKLKDGRRTLLTYFDGGSFLQIEDRRGRTDDGCMLHLLEGTQRDVYLFAAEIRPWNAFRDRFDLEESALKDLLKYFVDNKLMYEEEGHYLSLAMSEEPYRIRGIKNRGEPRESVYAAVG